MALDLSKPVQTRDGRPVTIITTEGREPWALLGYVSDDKVPRTWYSDGAVFSDAQSQNDPINAPEPKRSGVVWVNVYPKYWGIWGTKEAADREASPIASPASASPGPRGSLMKRNWGSPRTGQ